MLTTPIFGGEPYTPREEQMLRVMGLWVIIISVLFFENAHANTWFTLTSTIMDRFTFVPACLFALWLCASCPPELCITFVVLEPSLAALTWAVRRASSAETPCGVPEVELGAGPGVT